MSELTKNKPYRTSPGNNEPMAGADEAAKTHPVLMQTGQPVPYDTSELHLPAEKQSAITPGKK
jgi:hypothetical protein